MEIAEVLKIVGITSGIVLGIIGAIPQIIQWSKPKPHLVLKYIGFRSLMEENLMKENLKPDDRYRLHLILGNHERFWRRNNDATNVKVECHVIDMNRDQCGGINTISLSKNLPVGENVNKDFIIRPECRKGLNPHTLIVEISCDKGLTIKKEIFFDCYKE
jgi:hypothetical protein